MLVAISMFFASLPVSSAGSHNQKIDLEGGDRESKHPAVDARSGDVYCSYSAWDVDNNPPTWGIFLSFSPGVGRNWGPVGWVDQRVSPGSQCNEQDYSDIYMDQTTGKIHIVWQEKVNNNWVIMYRNLNPPAGWGPIIQLSNTGSFDAMYPKVAVDGSFINQNPRYVHVVWQEDSSGSFEVYYRDSDDRGVTWPTAPVIISGADNQPSIHPVIEVEYREGPGQPVNEYVHVAWEQDNSRLGTPNQVYIYSAIRIAGAGGGLAPQYNPTCQAISPSPNRQQTHPDITADFGEFHVVWVQDFQGGNVNLGNVWIAHDNTAYNNLPPGTVYQLTAGGHPCQNLVDRFSWGPAVDFDDNVPGTPGNRIAVAYTAYLEFDPDQGGGGIQNTELFCDIANGAGVAYVWNVPTVQETATPNVYEHYPDVAVEEWLWGPGVAPTNTYAHIVYERQDIPFGPWTVWYIREP